VKFFKKRKFKVSKQAICESEEVGPGTQIWPFSHVLSGAIIGRDCNICENVFIENDVHIGNRVTIKNGVQLWDGVEIQDDVFIGPNVTFTNDLYPISKNEKYLLKRTIVEKGASIGANATILPGLVIGEKSLVGAGAVVTRDVAPFTVVVGNPAREVRKIEERS
jgi:acetyltransferase-like isoleucine patch superfamily enzyme